MIKAYFSRRAKNIRVGKSVLGEVLDEESEVKQLSTRANTGGNLVASHEIVAADVGSDFDDDNEN